MISVLGVVSSLVLGDGLVKLVESSYLCLLVFWVGSLLSMIFGACSFLFFCLYSGLGKDEKTKIDVLCIMSTLFWFVIMQPKDVQE